MNHTTRPSDNTAPGHLLIRWATVTTVAVIATIGPGIGLAQAAISRNHNEVMVTGR